MCTKAHTQAQIAWRWMQDSGYKSPPRPRWIDMWHMHVTLGSRNVTSVAGQWPEKKALIRWANAASRVGQVFTVSHAGTSGVYFLFFLHSIPLQNATAVFHVAISVEIKGDTCFQAKIHRSIQPAVSFRKGSSKSIFGFPSLQYNKSHDCFLEIRPLWCHKWNSCNNNNNNNIFTFSNYFQ